MMKCNILIIEDSKVFAKGIRMLLTQLNYVDNIYTALDYQAALSFLVEKNVSLVILDLNFRVSEYDGFMIAEKIKLDFSDVKIMILTDYVQTDYYYRLFENNNVKGYMDKQSDEDQLFEGIKTIIAGGIYLCPSIQKLKEIDKWMVFTRREKEVIELLVKGLTQSRISEILFISDKTVGRHVMNLLQKFKVKNTTELVAKYVRYKNSNDERVDEHLPPFKNN